MTSKYHLLVVAVVTAFPGAAALAETPMLPGLYETKTVYPGQGGSDTTRDCVTPAEVRNATVERKLAETLKDQSCNFTSRSFGGGKFAIAGTCNNEGVKSSFKQTGTYSPTAMTFNMTMTMVPAPGAKPVSLNMSSTSRRIAASCPAGSRDD